MILITGASSGIGAACARRFAAEGYPLLLVARRADRLSKLQAELKRLSSANVEIAALDVRDEAKLQDFEKQFSKSLGTLHTLVNCAGLARGADPFQDAKLEDWDEMIETNLRSLLRVTRLALPYFLQQNKGHIVNLGSVAGQITYPNGNVYCATKAAVHSLTEALRLDLCGKGIRVTEISPGMVETEFSIVRMRSEEKAKKVYAGMTPLTADDVADTIVWAVSRPSHVNIQQIVLYPTDQASPTLVHRRPS